MPEASPFTHTEPHLLPQLEELRLREPIFHTPASAAPEHTMAPGYWEVGASGRRYSRDFLLAHLAQNPPVDAASQGWHTADHALRQLAHDTFLLTYVLHQPDRLTRRATLWQRTPAGWRILYHQGTLVTAEEDDLAPSETRTLAQSPTRSR